jgi:chromosome segregation ATPase
VKQTVLRQLVIVILQSSLLLSFLSGCNFKENEKLKAQNDSLRVNLQANNRAVVAIKEISVLIDSVDAVRDILRLQMLEGIPYKDYSERMTQVLDYVNKSKTKIEELQKKFQRLSDSTSGYVMMIDALKSELTIASEHIADLQLQVQKAEEKNNELMTLVKVQKSTIDNNEQKIKESKKEISAYETRIGKLVVQSQLYEAELYFTKAEVAYEEARQTKLAPRKKKEILKEAMELYKKSSELGNKQASARVTELQGKI